MGLLCVHFCPRLQCNEPAHMQLGGSIMWLFAVESSFEIKFGSKLDLFKETSLGLDKESAHTHGAKSDPIAP